MADSGSTTDCDCTNSWREDPEEMKARGLPEGFCSICEICGEAGHWRPYPGDIGYRAALCHEHLDLIGSCFVGTDLRNGPISYFKPVIKDPDPDTREEVFLEFVGEMLNRYVHCLGEDPSLWGVFDRSDLHTSVRSLFAHPRSTWKDVEFLPSSREEFRVEWRAARG